MSTIEELEKRLRDARAEADRATAAHRSAEDRAGGARTAAAQHEERAEAARLFGTIPTRKSRLHERLAAECREDIKRAERAEKQAAPVMEEKQAELRSVDEDLVKARRVEIDQEVQRQARIGEAIHTDVTTGDLTWEEAYGDGVIASVEVHARYEKALERDDEVDDGFWGTGSDDSADDGYADAAAESVDDQLQVMYLDRSIDTGERTYEEVYTPEGHIRADLLRDEEPEEQEAAEATSPEPESKKEEPTRDRGFELDEPF
ncbi:hypothetical protein [Nocardiopsis sp. NPDC006938]|uniref:hypothetical protein n=1 Tax=Nocardiopsis sp. NPDC006938 TaxID=3364337 RepID=UPI003697AD45